jgi:hypothetical protein
MALRRTEQHFEVPLGDAVARGTACRGGNSSCVTWTHPLLAVVLLQGSKVIVQAEPRCT